MVLGIIGGIIAAVVIGHVFTITSIIVAIYKSREFIQGCGEFIEDQPTLGVTTKDTTYASTDSRVYARILTKDDYDNYDWSEWKKLDNSGCNDREKGRTDFYDDFSDITDEWEAVALYNCGTDGWALDSITYWNGTDSNNEILMFCDNVAGPSVNCYVDEVDDPEASCYPGFNDRLYDYVWIDQNDRGCPGITLKLQAATGRDLFVGKVFAQSNPGIPDCSVNNALSINAKTIPDNNGSYNYVFTVSPTMFYFIIGPIIILLLANIFCYGYKNCANRKSKRSKYSKVNQVVSSEDEAHHLNA